MLLLTLQAALSTLLPGNCYHGMDFLAEINSTQSHEAQPHSLPARPLHQPGRGVLTGSQFWLAMSQDRASPQQIREYFRCRGCSAVCDVPCLQFWPRILQAFPRAKGPRRNINSVT